MKGRISKLTATFLALSCASIGFASTTLDQVYSQALQNDTTYKGAEATYLSAKENMPLAVANMLPTIAGSAAYNKANSPGYRNHYWGTGWGATLTQNIFNWPALAGISKAKASVRAALASYQAAKQTLIQSTVSAYLDVIQDAATVGYDHAYTNQLSQLLKQQEQKFKVGIIPITDVYKTRSTYDTQLAQNIADENTLDSAIESLRAITGHAYTSIQGVGAALPLHSPNPNNMQQWVNTATTQNLGIIAAQAQVDVDKATVSGDRGAHLPSLSLTGSYQQTHNKNVAVNHQIKNPNVSSVGLSLSVPIFSGGAMFAQTRQDAYTQQADQQTLDGTVRTTVANTRTNYMAVLAAISGVKAAQQAYIAANQTLKATRAGYQVGTNTIVDVLTDMSNRIKAQQTIVNNQISYLNAIIALKQEAGNLNGRDVKAISKILDKEVLLPNTLTKHHSSRSSQPAMTDAQKSAKLANNGQSTTVASTTKAMTTIHSTQTKPNNAQTAALAEEASYSIQLFASNSKTRANKFIKNYLDNNSNAFISEHVTNGQTYYLVMFGHYNSPAAAAQVIAHFSTPVQRLKPWVKTVN